MGALRCARKQVLRTWTSADWARPARRPVPQHRIRHQPLRRVQRLCLHWRRGRAMLLCVSCPRPHRACADERACQRECVRTRSWTPRTAARVGRYATWRPAKYAAVSHLEPGLHDRMSAERCTGGKCADTLVNPEHCGHCFVRVILAGGVSSLTRPTLYGRTESLRGGHSVHPGKVSPESVSGFSVQRSRTCRYENVL